MAIQTLVFDFQLNTEKHPIILENCPSSCGTAKVQVAKLPITTPICLTCREVVLQIKDSALVVQACDEVNLKGIKGNVVERLQLTDCNGCPISKYRYTVEYDDAQLVDPLIPLKSCDLDGFDCYSYADEYVYKKLLCNLADLPICDLIQECFEEVPACPSTYFIGA